MRDVNFSNELRRAFASRNPVAEEFGTGIESIALIGALPEKEKKFSELPKGVPVVCSRGDEFQLREIIRVLDALELLGKDLPKVRLYNLRDGDDAADRGIYADVLAYLYPYTFRPTGFGLVNHVVDRILGARNDDCLFMGQSPKSYYARNWRRVARDSGARIIFNIFGGDTLPTEFLDRPPFMRSNLGTLKLNTPYHLESVRRMDVLVHQNWASGKRLWRGPNHYPPLGRHLSYAA